MTSQNLQDVTPTVEIHPDADHADQVHRTVALLESALRGQPGVVECVLRERMTSAGASELVAYLVLSGPLDAPRLTEALQSVLPTLPASYLPAAYVPLTALPLTADGQIDETALQQVPVLDETLALAWEQRAKALPGVADAAVLRQPFAPAQPALHLSDVLPDGPTAPSRETIEAVPMQPTPETSTSVSSVPALSEGAALEPFLMPGETTAPVTLPQALRRAARLASEAGAVYVQPDGSEIPQTYPQLLEEAQRLLAGLHAQGLKAGDYLLFQLDRNQDYLPAFWGCVLGGIIPVPVSIAPTYEQLNPALSKLHSAWEMLDKPCLLTGHDLAPSVRALAGMLEVPTEEWRVLDIEDVRTEGAEEPAFQEPASDPEAVTLLLLTSGSTGKPKGVPLTHRNLLAMAAGTIQISGFTPAEVTLNWMPLDHVGAISFLSTMSVYLGCRQVHVPTSYILQSPLRWLDLMTQHKASISWAPNFAFGLINDRTEEIQAGSWDLSAMRFLVSAGESVVARTARRFLRLLSQHGLSGEALHPAFGMSETCSGISWSESFSLSTSSDSAPFVEIGPPIPGASYRIVDEQDQLVGEGVIGHLHLKGPSVFAGYFANEELNRTVFHAGDWFDTGDLGFLSGGCLTLTGRQKDVIVLNGVNIYSHEIEAVIEEVPGVEVSFTAACPVRLPGQDTDDFAIFFHSPLFGSDAAATEEAKRELLLAIRSAVARNIGSNPAVLLPLERGAIPKTDIGKIQRPQLRKRFEAGEYADLQKEMDLLLGSDNTLPDWFLRPVWRRKSLALVPASISLMVDTQRLAAHPNPALIFLNREGVGCALGEQFAVSAHDYPCVFVEPGKDFARWEAGEHTYYSIDPANPTHYDRLLDSLNTPTGEAAERPDSIIHLWTYGTRQTAIDTLSDLESAQEKGLYSLLFLTQALDRRHRVHAFEKPVRLLVVSSEAQPVLPQDVVAYEHAPLVGLVKTLSQEMPHIDCRHVDLLSNSVLDPIQRAALLLDEWEGGSEREVAYRNGQRFVLRLEKTDIGRETPGALPFQTSSLFLLSGGLGGLAAEVGAYLLTTYGVRLLLIGRTPLPDRSEWDAHLQAGGPLAERIRTFQSLEQAGAVRYEAVDVCDLDGLRQAVDHACTEWDCPLAGVLHLATAYHDRLLNEETVESFSSVLRPKMGGAWTLHRLVQERPDCAFISFSSAAGFFGGAMIGAYSTANHFLDVFSSYRRQQGRSAHSFAWSTWEEVGISRGHLGQEILRSRGLMPIPVEQGIHSLLAGLAQQDPCLLVGMDSGNTTMRRFLEPARPEECRTLELVGVLQPDLSDGDRSPLARLSGMTLQDRFGTEVPCRFQSEAELPRTETGEIDRDGVRDLLDARRRGAGSRERIAPETPTEEKLSALWQEALGVRTFGVEDDFFTLGGSSLLATRMLARVREEFGLELTLQSLFAAPTIRKIAALVADTSGDALASAVIPLASRSEVLPLSFAQQRFWFLDQLMPGSPSSNVPFALRLTGHLEADTLQRAFREMIARHESLRTTFPEVEGEPLQQIASVQVAADFELPVETLSHVAVVDREAEAQRIAAEEASTAFDLAVGPLLRARLLQIAPDDHLLVVNMHHIISDGWSVRVMVRELTAHYAAFTQGQETSLPELPLQYADFAAWQRDRLQGRVLDEQLDWWTQQLEGAPSLLELPSDRPRPAISSGRGGHQTFALSPDLSERLWSLSQAEGATLFMTILAAFQTLVSRYTGQEDVVVSTAAANRDRKELEPLLGCLINILLLRTDLSGDPTFRDLLRRVRESSLGAFAHAELPFERLVDAIQPERDLRHNPLTEVMFVLLNAPIKAQELPGLKVEQAFIQTAASTHDFVLHMVDTPSGLTGFVDYSADLFDDTTITRMLEHFVTLLEGIVAEPQKPAGSLPLLAAKERQQVIVEWNATAVEYPREKCLHELFAEQVQRTPDAAAVVFGEGEQKQSLTYHQLNARANQLAHYLRREGIGPDVLVGLCVERSLEMVVGLLGILKAGGAYVPIDPIYPRERIAYMLADANAPILLTQQALLASLPSETKRVCLDTDWDLIGKESTENPANTTASADLAYVIYTSGSTGNPKGVQIPHQPLVNFLLSMQQEPGLTASDTLLAVTTICFDIAGLELYVPLLTGAKVVLLPQEAALDGTRLADAMAEHQVTVMQATPATWRLLLEAGWLGTPGLKILCGGEPLPRDLANRLLSGGGELWNMYGPTETTIWSTVWQVTPGDGAVLIGKPIANTQCYLLDAHLQPVPVGVAGELYIAGDGLARGYHQRPELTEEKFVPDPFRAGAKMYLTGDLARQLPDGTIECLGRTDHQIKIRGFRIELGEIEAALTAHPAVRQSVVTLRELGTDKQLVAYLVGEGEEFEALSAGMLRDFLKARLPDYMVPAAFVKLDTFPLTPNGKLDRKRLPAPEEAGLAPVGEGEYVAPRTPTEERLAALWSTVLHREPVSVEENFFMLGGHSLLAASLMSRLRSAFGVDLPLRALFETPTIAGLAQRIEEQTEAGTSSEGETIQPRAWVADPETGAIIAPASFGQRRFWLIDRFEQGSSAYNLPLVLRLTGELRLDILESALTQLAQRQESLRTTFRETEGQTLQVIAPAASVSVPVVDFSSLPEGERETAALRFAEESIEAPFDMEQGPLWRVHLLRLAPEEALLVVNIHHIVSDGWSINVLQDDLSALYNGLLQGDASPLPALPIQYVDYAQWQRERLTEEAQAEELAYWTQQLDGLPTLLELPMDHPRPPVQSFRGANLAVTVPDELIQRLTVLSQQEGVTLFMTLMAAFQLLLARHSGQEKFIVSTGIANRDQPETQTLIGCLINILLFRTDLSGEPTFRDLLQRVRETSLGAYAHQDLPFEKLVDALQPERDLSYNQLTQVMFVLLSGARETLALDGIATSPVKFETSWTAYDLVLHMFDAPAPEGGMVLHLDYATDLYEAATIQRLVGHFVQLLEALVASPAALQQPVWTLPLLTEAERHQILVEWNETTTPFPDDKCLHELFEEQVRLQPDAPAVLFGDETLSYVQLDRRANQLAHYLIQQGVGPDTLVGLSVERSFEMIVGLLGIHKAGGAYVPLDPSYPPERLAFMLEDTHAPVLLTQSHLLDRLPAFEGPLLCLDRDGALLDGESEEKPETSVTYDNLCYVIFTSGSTGVPKGISLRHQGVLNNVTDLNRRFDVGPRDRMLALSSLSFDMCVYEVFGSLMAGGAIVMPRMTELREPAAWANLVQRHSVTIWNSAPALLKMLVDYVEPDPHQWPRTLRLALLGGDWVPVNLPDRLKAMTDLGPAMQVIVMGGATEASIHSTIYDVVQTDPTWKSIPYGHPMANQKVYVLDDQFEPVPIGVAGELYLGGIGLGRGYWERLELSAERFLPNPFCPGERIYRTGDLVRWRADGDLELIGRRDYQVKLRGLRIELGEIEAAIRQHPGVREAVVAAKETEGTDKRLVGYLIPSAETAGPAARLLSMERDGTLTNIPHSEMPNGMMVAYQNKAEMEFGYREIFEEEGYLKHGIRVKDGDCIFDVGANIGLFALHMAAHCPNARFYAFEPIPPVFNLLKINTTLYGLDIKLFQMGISDAAKQDTFTYYPHLTLISGRFADKEAERETVRSFLRNEHQEADSEALLEELLEERLETEQVDCELKTISQVIRENGVTRIDLLKIDVEKGELEALAGIEEEDWPKIRQVVLEVNDHEGRLEWILDLLKKHGFSVTAEQDEMMTATAFYNLFAIRADEQEETPAEAEASGALPAAWSWTTPERLMADVRQSLKERLPDYMTPSALMVLEKMPLSPNGKVDRKALPVPELAVVETDSEYVAPRSLVEEIVADIFADVLALNRVSLHDNFFERGGHSLLATQVISRIRTAFQVELPLRTLFEAPTIHTLSLRIEAAREEQLTGREAILAPPLLRTPRRGTETTGFPLSAAQMRLWIVDQMSSGNAAYNVVLSVRITGAVDQNALQKSLNEIMRRHEALRTTFRLVNGEPAQFVSPNATLPLQTMDLRTLPAEERKEKADRLVVAFVKKPFDLAKGPLLRAALLRTGETDYRFLTSIHHIAADGWSLNLFNQELSVLYAAYQEGRPSPLPEPELQYADYAVWQQWLQGEPLERQLEYWKRQMEGAAPSLDLPTDFERPPAQSFKGARYPFELPAELITQAKQVSHAEGVTLFMTLLAAFDTLLYAYSGQSDVIVGAPLAGRTREETEQVIGFFINTVVFRADLSGNPTFREVLARVREVTLGADAHQDVHFDKLVETLRPPRDRSRNPLFQVNFRVQTNEPAALDFPGAVVSPLQIVDIEASKFDLAIDLMVGESFRGFFEYSVDLFNEETIRRMRDDLETLLYRAFADPEIRLEELAHTIKPDA